MALLGHGVLAIWNGIADGAAADFEAWHIGEHIPERVGVPGFLRGRRYVGVDGHPAYFNFYETESTMTLVSTAYHARLNDPTPWTRRVVARFTDTIRTVCTVASSLGVGEGAWIETLRFQTVLAPDELRHRLGSGVLTAAAAESGVVGVHLLRGEEGLSGADTTEKSLRGRPDRVAAWVLLIEAVEASHLQRLRAGNVSEAALRGGGVTGEIERGLYRLQFALTKTELNAGPWSIISP